MENTLIFCSKKLLFTKPHTWFHTHKDTIYFNNDCNPFKSTPLLFFKINLFTLKERFHIKVYDNTFYKCIMIYYCRSKLNCYRILYDIKFVRLPPPSLTHTFTNIYSLTLQLFFPCHKHILSL